MRLAESAGAPYQAFLARVREETGEALALADPGSPESDRSDTSDSADTSALVLGGRWVVAPAPGIPGRLHGVAVDLDGLLAAIGDEMRQLGLISDRDRVVAARSPADLLPAGRVATGDLRLQVTSPAWDQALGAIGARHALKTGLVAVSALFALAIVSLALVLQHRRHQLLELKADFVAAVSHELRTPLASMRLLGETLERRLAGHPAARDYPSRIVREADGLSFLVENILSFQRLEKGRQRSPGQGHSDVPLTELVDFLRSELELQVARPLRLEYHGPGELTLHGDGELLKLLFLNLARNACQYNAREPVVISITAGSDNGGCRLHVRDNGWGLAPAETRKVFTEFYRARTEGTRGTGLGLAICRRVMELHRGTIRIADTGPEGTTFELLFRT